MSLDKFLRVKQVAEITGLSRATIYNLEKTGDFPKKIALGARAVAWRESEIANWLESRSSAQKVGREAKPGRPPTKLVDKSLEPSAKTEPITSLPPTSTENLAEGDVSSGSGIDWDGDDLPIHVLERMEKNRDQQRLLNKTKRPPSSAVSKRSHKIVLATTIPKPSRPRSGPLVILMGNKKPTDNKG